MGFYNTLLTKEELRSQIKNHSKAIPASKLSEKSKIIFDLLIKLDQFNNARCVFTYVSKNNEVDTLSIIKHCLETGKKVVVPKVIPTLGALQIREIKSIATDLQKGSYGILEPVESCTEEVNIESIDVAVIPMVAFDVNNNRLGHGKGYFDRFLSRLKQNVYRIGLGFDFQKVENLPVDSHDQPVHQVLFA